MNEQQLAALAAAFGGETDLTLLRMKIRQKFKPTDSAKIPVRMLPRYLVISGESFLVLGEFYEKESLYYHYYIYSLEHFGNDHQPAIFKKLLQCATNRLASKRRANSKCAYFLFDLRGIRC
jgi:hypothetical protein